MGALNSKKSGLHFIRYIDGNHKVAPFQYYALSAVVDELYMADIVGIVMSPR